MDLLNINLEGFIKDSGKMIIDVERDFKNFKIIHIMKDNFIKVRWTEKEYILGIMEINIKVTGKMV